jgi:hypothetical protein
MTHWKLFQDSQALLVSNAGPSASHGIPFQIKSHSAGVSVICWRLQVNQRRGYGNTFPIGQVLDRQRIEYCDPLSAAYSATSRKTTGKQPISVCRDLFYRQCRAVAMMFYQI